MTLHAVPTFTPEDRHALDRRAPAMLREEHGQHSVYTSFDGIEREVFAADAADARRIRAIHDALGTWTPEEGLYDPVREAIVLAVRAHATDPLAVAP